VYRDAMLIAEGLLYRLLLPAAAAAAAWKNRDFSRAQV